jgi:hypothetical protein
MESVWLPDREMKVSVRISVPTTSVDVRNEFSVIVVVALISCFLHFYGLNAVPAGWFIDESSIGYNAYLISRSGVDEHGVSWPLYFEAFGEYKNPIYIYFVAALFKMLGYSVWVLRATSAACWMIGSIFLYRLCCHLFADLATRSYVLLVIAFTPWLFAISRISFEVITLYVLLSLHLLALYRGFQERSLKWAAVSGLAIGSCLYAYTTFRMLAPFYCTAVLGSYCSRRYRPQQVAFVLGAGISALPYIFYSWKHFDNLTARFSTVTYVFDQKLTLSAKVGAFVLKYFQYFTPSFLMLSGDANLRHHSGFGGELFVTTTIFLAVALVRVLAKRKWRDPFRVYLVLGVLLAPVAAALTDEEQHSLRSFSMVVFAIVLSAYGVHTLNLFRARLAVVLTALCAALYLIHYFVVYRPSSAEAFGNYNFRHVLHEAVDRRPRRIVLSSMCYQPYINLLFFGSLERTSIPLVIGSRRDVAEGDVFISYDSSAGSAGYYVLVDPQT